MDIQGAWKKFVEMDVGNYTQETYEAAEALLKRAPLTQENIYVFSKNLAKEKLVSGISQKMGLFLSAAINLCPAKRLAIECTPKYPISYLCYKNEKDVSINGNAGDCCCAKMKAGQVQITGTAGEALGLFMEGGRIEVLGSVKSISEEARPYTHVR